MRNGLLVCLTVLSVGLWVGSAQSSDPKKPDYGHDHGHDHGDDHGHDHAHDHGEQPDFAPVKAGPEHQALLRSVGQWKTVEKHYMDPSGEPMMAYGVSKITKVLDGLGTLVEHESTSDMGPFKGVGLFTWNATTKKYEGSWVDSFSYNGLDPMDGTWDPATKTLTWTYTWTMPDGTKIPSRMVQQEQGPDKMVANFYCVWPGSEEKKSMEIAYTRM